VLKSQVGKGNTPTPIAVIEFKRRGILHHDKFMTRPVKSVGSGAANPPRPTKAEIDAFKKEALAANQNEKTLFKNNALKCMKQISAYAVDRQTKYCALFDYDALVLVMGGDGALTTPLMVETLVVSVLHAVCPHPF